MRKIIKRLGFEQMDYNQLSALHEFMDFTKELANKTGDQRAIAHAQMRCDRLYSLFKDEEALKGTNVISFKGENFYD